MWHYLLLGGGGLLCYISSVSVSDIASVGSVPWYGLASAVLSIRYYQGFLFRISYILLLIYWYAFVSGGGYLQSEQYTHILFELARSRSATYGETNVDGIHWTLNIASFLIYTAINDLGDALLPTWFWSRLAFNMLLEFVVFGHPVYQLFLQQQIAWLVRWNRNLFRWRDYAMELLVAKTCQKFDNKYTRALLYIWWWAGHMIYKYFTPDLMSRISTNFLVLQMTTWVFDAWKEPSPFINKSIHYATIYFIWFRELFRFSNPNPPMFKYSKLQKPDHIRLLLLHPRFGFRPVSGSMVDGPYMRLLFYEAISYTWGNPERTEEIMVDGCRMMVTKSVYEVLATLSSQFLPQLLWIDAICIDQENEEEKEQQVPIMDTIYSNALFTTVFLGQSPLPESTIAARKDGILPYQFDGIVPPDDQTRNHFETARLTISTFNEFNILKYPLRSSGKTMYELYEAFLSPSTKSRQWQALITFLQHPWFARVWVVQEVALSPHVQVRYGDETIDWRIMASAVTMIHNLRHFRLWLEWSHNVQIRHAEHSSLYNIMRIDKLRENLWPSEKYGFAKEVTITHVLAESTYFKATNPRDQVYGLMSLCGKKSALTVDYQASVESVYMAAAKELIDKKSMGLLFGLAGIGNRTGREEGTLDLPSWVPDWTNAPKYDRIKHPIEDSFDYRWKVQMGNSDEPKSDITISDDNTLLITGTFVTTVTEVGPSLFNTPVTESNGVVDEMHHLYQNYSNCKEFLKTSNYTSDPYAHADCQSLIEAFHNSLNTGRKDNLTSWAEQLENFRLLPETRTDKERDGVFDILQQMDNMTQKIEGHCGGRRMFVAEDGWIGLCPPGARIGDRVFAVKGVKVSIVLRETDGELEKRYNLVGECYCHGLEPEKLEFPELKVKVV
ncbi:hypothetical protein ONS96_003072 [Cadophora gregata f. sp. sojae]|nr:hypothetical protein ONS96_003072 [Cadophora gregata f. sp. sojae]